MLSSIPAFVRTGLGLCSPSQLDFLPSPSHPPNFSIFRVIMFSLLSWMLLPKPKGKATQSPPSLGFLLLAFKVHIHVHGFFL